MVVVYSFCQFYVGSSTCFLPYSSQCFGLCSALSGAFRHVHKSAFLVQPTVQFHTITGVPSYTDNGQMQLAY